MDKTLNIQLPLFFDIQKLILVLQHEHTFTISYILYINPENFIYENSDNYLKIWKVKKIIEELEQHMIKLDEMQKSILTHLEVPCGIDCVRITILIKDLVFFSRLQSYIPLLKFHQNGIIQMERDLGAVWLERSDNGEEIIYRALVLRKPISD